MLPLPREAWQNLFDQSPDAIIIHEPDKQILEVNKKATRLLGFSRTELLKMEISDIHPAEAREISQTILQRVKQREAMHYEIEFRKKDSTVFPAEVSATPFKYINNIAIQTVIRDITARKLTEQAVKNSEKKLQSIIKAIPDIVYRLDSDSRILFISDSIREYGYEPSELVGKNIFDLIHPEDREKAFFKVNERRTGNRRTRSFEIRFLTRDKKYISFDIHAKGLYQEPVFVLEAEGLYNSDVPRTDSFLGSQGVARDVSIKKAAQTAVAESEKKLNSILSSMVDLVFLFDENGKLITAHCHNNGFLGNMDDADGKSYEEIFPARLHGLFSKAFRTNQNGHTSESEFWIRKQEEKLWYSAKFSPTYSQGSYSGSVAVIRDITERKMTEEMLRRKSRQDELMLDIARHLTSTLELKQVLTQIGKSAKDILKARECSIYTLDEKNNDLKPVVHIPGNSNLKRTSRGYSTEDHCTTEAIKKGKGLIFNHIKIKGSMNGNNSPHLIVVPFITEKKIIGALCLQRTSRAFLDEDLSLAETFAAFASTALKNAHTYQELQREVKVRQQAEKSRLESEEQYRQFFEEDLTGDYISTADGRLLACNSAFMKIFGFRSREEALNTNVASLYPYPEDRLDFLQKLIENRKMEYHEMELRRRDGKAVYVIANMAGKFDKNGNLMEIKGYLFDNTEQKILEQQFRQAQKMEAIGRLAGGVAHDFNNLLTIITGYSELLLHRLPKNDKSVKDIQHIKEAGEKASRLTNQLLAFSRRQVLQPKLINLNAIVKEVSKMLHRLIGEDIELEMNLEPDLGTIQADPGQLEQVLMNLAINARDAMPGGGRLIIETTNVIFARDYVHKHIAIQPAGNYVLLSIQDTGTGMDENTQAHIFEPFFTTKEYGKGTGLGLSTVYGIVKQSGGFIWVNSSVSKGTTFTIYFPRVQGDAGKSPVSPEKMRTSEGGSETILLVEDEEMVREMAVRILKEKGYTVLASGHGTQAMEVSNNFRKKIDLLVTDIVMPGMSGKELVQNIRKERPDLKVLYISGYTDEVISQQGLLEEDVNFLQKPFPPQKLLMRIREVLEEEKKDGDREKGKGKREKG
ncbi:MAG: PAS domain S-box protein [Calditrichaeota bacterium]|nr:PAS domain S-box protein [Calditrichota bacterium]